MYSLARAADWTEASLTRSCCSETDEMKRKLGACGQFPGGGDPLTLHPSVATRWEWLVWRGQRAKAQGSVTDTWGRGGGKESHLQIAFRADGTSSLRSPDQNQHKRFLSLPLCKIVIHSIGFFQWWR